MFPEAEGPATNLDDLHLTLWPEPLLKPEEIEKYYRPQMNKVRGSDTVAKFSLKLQQSYGALPFKAFLMGHAGVGKSTEISRLLQRVEEQHVGIRLSVSTELNPASFKVFDVLVLMLVRLAEEAERLQADPIEGTLTAHLVSDIEQLFATEQVKKIRKGSAGVAIEVGAGVSEKSPWASILGLFASTKAEMKYAAERTKETIEYRLQRLPDLVDVCNRLINVCDQALREKNGKEWILVVEDLDKTGISPQQLQELFIQYGTVFQDLRVNMIFTIPIWLAYSPEANRLPFERYMIYDTPVFDQKHSLHEEGRAAIREVLAARVSPDLFGAGQMNRLIVASGGNLRDLFALVLDAGEEARLRDGQAQDIGPEDADKAIHKMRRDYRMRLGQSPYDAIQIQYSDKLIKLLSIYGGPSANYVPDAVLYSLLRARAIQEFNGPGWFGVHPLVVDLLKDQKELPAEAAGGTG